MTEFICPRSGEPCVSQTLCSSQKEAMEGGYDAFDILEGGLPGAIRVALKDAGFCATRRIESLIGVAESDSVDHPTAVQASSLAGHLQVARDLFPSPPGETAL